LSGLDQLYSAHRESSDKYTYFLLAAAGAAIAFAATQTQTAIISWAKLPLAAAALCWALSFYCGCCQIHQVNNLLQRNFQLLRVKAGNHPQFPNDPQFVQFIEKDMETLSNKSGWWGVHQFRLLIAGAAFYIAWHVAEMAIRTPGLLSRLGL
jgi:hypothetical protein